MDGRHARGRTPAPANRVRGVQARQRMRQGARGRASRYTPRPGQPYPQKRRYETPRPYERRPARRWRLMPLVLVVLVSLLVLALLVVGVAIVLRGCTPQAGDASQSPAADEAVVSEAERKAEPVEVRIAMIGDILQHMGVYTSGQRADGTYDFTHVFAHITDDLGGQDIKVVNQETPIAGAEFGFSGYPVFNGPQEMGDAEAAAGFNVVLRASNHTMDRGYDGLAAELAFWETSHPEVAVIGAVDPDEAAAGMASPYDAYVYEKDGFTVALLNFTYGLNGFEDPNGAIALLDEERVRVAIETADEQADAVVVFPHWGVEYQLYASDEQRAMAQVMIDAGADAIIGGHPHVVEPFEVLTASDGRQVPCFWSVGNFISTQIDNVNLVGCLAKVVLRKDGDGTVSATHAEFWPTVTHKGVGENMTTYLLRDYTDDLAATNALAGHSSNTSLTVGWADDFFAEELGEGYDAGAHMLAADLAATGGTAVV